MKALLSSVVAVLVGSNCFGYGGIISGGVPDKRVVLCSSEWERPLVQIWKTQQGFVAELAAVDTPLVVAKREDQKTIQFFDHPSHDGSYFKLTIQRDHGTPEGFPAQFKLGRTIQNVTCKLD